MRQRVLSFFLFLFIMLQAFTAQAADTTGVGQSYETFTNFYKENISFINHNVNRHLLPLVITKVLDPTDGTRMNYSLLGDTLNAVITTEPGADIIESCVITLNAPSGMEYGNAVYQDFSISGYQSYALLMAMSADPDPARRYALVTDVVQGMADNNGHYERQLGVYTLSCTRVDNSAELAFYKGSRPGEATDTENSEDEDAFMPDMPGVPEEDTEDMDGLL